jgi:hypothetical protein
MAATLEEAANEGDGTWSEFALVARDLGGGKPLDAIPLHSLMEDLNFVNRTNGRYRSAAEEPVVRIHSPPAVSLRTISSEARRATSAAFPNLSTHYESDRHQLFSAATEIL